MKPQGQADCCLGVTGQAWEPCSEPPNEPLRLWLVCDLISDFIYRCPIGFSQGECIVCVCVCYCPCVLERVRLWVGACACVTEPNLGTYLCKVKLVSWHQLVMKESAVYCRSLPRSPGSSCAESQNSLMGFRRPFLKSRWGRGSEHIWSACAQFSGCWWWGNQANLISCQATVCLSSTCSWSSSA